MWEDTYKAGIVLSNLARLWHVSGDAQLIDAIAPIVGGTHEEVEEWFQAYLKESNNEGEEKK